MCRWAAWQGAPIFLSDVITTPAHGLIQQSRDALECKTPINGDGFGLAWYDQRPEPGLYRDVYPAWSDPNLRSLTHQIRAGTFLAHVRASTGTATSRNNCHPFVHRHWTFMHNGQVGGFDRFRKAADMMIADHIYPDRKATTDSEALFLVACGIGIDDGPQKALEQAVAQFEVQSHSHGVTPHMRLAAALSDGESLYAVRYASDAHAPSLYYRWSDEGDGWSVVSEPYETGLGDWIEVPKGSFCCFTKTKVSISTFAPSGSAGRPQTLRRMV